MKKTLKTKARVGFVALLFITAISVKAQKLNQVQEGGMRAPANVKVDAKATEWNDTYQAFNKATDIYYTLANDDANLYLVIKSSNQTNNNKILGGGVTLTINTENKKKAKDAFIVGFPNVDLAKLREQVMSSMSSMRGGGGGRQSPDSTAIANMRKKAVSTAKEIKVIGFKDITDSVISIYNEYGIKAQADFDTHANLIIEMAIPLKYFHISSDAVFTYNIKLNGIQIDAIFPGASAMMTGGGGGFGGGGGGGGFGGGGGGMPPGGAGVPRGMADMASMISPTDFWGKYTLAKK